jgi:RHS repeat-associated protein
VNASFAYDGVGRRRAKTVAGTTTQFLYDGLNPVQELSGGSPVANLLTGLGIDEYFARTDAAGVREFLTDALGSTVALADGSGSVETEYSYEPFGGTTTSGASTTSAYGFTGREADGTGLYYYRARYYDSRQGRFLTEDPIGIKGGINVYQYALNDPVNLFDSLGLDVTICFYPDAAFGYGHLGFGFPTEGGTSGFASAGRRPFGPGVVRPDVYPRSDCRDLPSPPDKDECMRECRKRREKDPGDYGLFSRNCTAFVRDCLKECKLLPGGADGTGPRPEEFFRRLFPPPKRETIPMKR